MIILGGTSNKSGKTASIGGKISAQFNYSETRIEHDTFAKERSSPCQVSSRATPFNRSVGNISPRLEK